MKPLLCIFSPCVGMLISALFNVNLLYLNVCVNLSVFRCCLCKCVHIIVYAYIDCPRAVMCKHAYSFRLFLCLCGQTHLCSILEMTNYNKVFAASQKNN